MKVIAKITSRENAPELVKKYVGVPSELTVDREYVVHALTAYDEVVLFQVVDDLQMPRWCPAALFEIVDHSLPCDWICNVLDVGRVVLGPKFVAESRQAYEDMVELDADRVDLFWKRIDRLEAEEKARKDRSE